MHPVRTIVLAVALVIGGCSAELDPNASTVEVEGPPNWELILTAETSFVTTVTIQENTLGFCGVDGTVDSNNVGYTGIGFANTDDASGNSVDWSVNVPTSGGYLLEWRFASSADSLSGNVLVNGANMATVEFQSTGSLSAWGVMGTTVNLDAGWNSLSLVAADSGGLPNIDLLTIIGNSPQAADCNGDPSIDPVAVKLETTLTAVLLDVSGSVLRPVILQLDSADSLRVTDGVQAIDLEPLESDERIYAGTFPEKVIGQDLIISLSKMTAPVNVDWWVPTDDSPEPDFSDFFIDAPNTQVVLPQPFTIDAPAYNLSPPHPADPDDGIDDDGMEEFALGSNVPLQWSPSGTNAKMRLVYTSRCGNILSGVDVVDIQGDPGIYEALVDSYLEDLPEAAVEAGCTIRLTLERETDSNNLTPDPTLSVESSLLARHRRFIEIKSRPEP